MDTKKQQEQKKKLMIYELYILEDHKIKTKQIKTFNNTTTCLAKGSNKSKGARSVL